MLIVDDHPVVRQGLRVLLEVQDGIEVAGEAADGATGRSRWPPKLAPDVILLDLKLPGLDGVAVLTELQPARRRPGAGPHQRRPDPARSAGRCARARPASCTRTSTRTRWSGPSAVHDGHMLLAPEAAGPAVPTAAAGHPVAGLDALTIREREVLAELAHGRSNREIARPLPVSEKTVKTHVSSVLAKLGVQDRTQAALFAVRHERQPLRGAQNDHGSRSGRVLVILPGGRQVGRPVPSIWLG